MTTQRKMTFPSVSSLETNSLNKKLTVFSSTLNGAGAVGSQTRSHCAAVLEKMAYQERKGEAREKAENKRHFGCGFRSHSL
jgi:hypothetical protein